jgi:hypothetical protein
VSNFVYAMSTRKYLLDIKMGGSFSDGFAVFYLLLERWLLKKQSLLHKYIISLYIYFVYIYIHKPRAAICYNHRYEES